MIQSYQLQSPSGNLSMEVLDIGCVVRSLQVPDRNGKKENIVLGFSNLEDYRENRQYFGGVVGRFANRIANASFALNGETYSLPQNNGPNCLHGGPGSFIRKKWNVDGFSGQDFQVLRMEYESPDGEEGFPGKLSVTVEYEILGEDIWILRYKATTDRTTVVNLTNHSYFNLGGTEGPLGSIEDHVLKLDSPFFLPTDATQIPTGDLKAVEGTPFDFRSPRKIGERIHEPHEQLLRAKGYDHTWALEHSFQVERPSARVFDPKSGRLLEMWTNEPGVQFYSGNYLNISGSGGEYFSARQGFCLETQHFPDSPNQPLFPNTILHPGDAFSSQTVFRFSTLPGETMD
ncbi:MAG TPA: aldose epimerase family protein [Thermotogota bacterium]|nr:aldose epimerase family protein [Thermotogota bacterium]